MMWYRFVINHFNTFFAWHQDASADRANKIFRELDANGDGELDENEFVVGCMDDGDLMMLLNSGGLTTTSVANAD
jgi:DNA polymerase II large subunit